MSQKWNLQDIRPAERSQQKQEQAVSRRPRQDMVPPKKPVHLEREFDDSDVSSIDVHDGNSEKRKRIIFTFVVVVLLIGAAFGINTLMGGAELIIHPKFKDVTVEATFKTATNPELNELGYELLTLEADGERQVAASGQEEAKELATGKILIYNANNPATQRLIKNTRFETPDGLIFRIKESVEIPGSTTDAKGKTAPGVVSADVFADGVGEQYNIGPSRFTVPGLKGSDQYANIYAESTGDMTGGFEGKRFIIEETELQTAQQSLQAELRDALLERLMKERPAGFVLYDNAVTFAFESQPATEYGDTLATIKEKARLQVPIFKEAELATYLASNTIAGYGGAPVAVSDFSTLSFSYEDPKTTTSDIAALNTLSFNLKGSVRIIWVYDEEKLRNDLAGLSKTALPNVLSSYPAIDKAEAVVRPFWRQSFPDAADEISVINKIE